MACSNDIRRWSRQVALAEPAAESSWARTEVTTAGCRRTSSRLSSLSADSRSGSLPRTEALMLSRLVKLCLPGLTDGQYAECDAEIAAFLDRRVAARAAGEADPANLQDVHRW